MVLSPGFSLQPCEEFQKFPDPKPRPKPIKLEPRGRDPDSGTSPSFLGDFSVQPGLKITGLKNWFQKFIVPQNFWDEFSRSGVGPQNLHL